MDEKGFKYSILASGSSGNSFYLETPKKKILVDAGLSGKKITGLLAEIDRKPEDLDAILITHEHSDHIHGVGVLARKYGMDLYANEATWKAMEGSKYLGKVDDSQKHLFEMGKTVTFGDLDVESFGVSHDAAAPQFYRFMKDGKSFVMLTDTGYVSDRMAGIVENADGYLIESNHDVEILRAGSYAWRLKQRILSDLGHLSNEDGADAMIRTLGNKTKKIYLGHLSKENNIKELAHMTMVNQLARADLAVGHDFDVLDTSPLNHCVLLGNPKTIERLGVLSQPLLGQCCRLEMSGRIGAVSLKYVYITVGFISLGLGIIGIPLPILPTTPFLLLAMACFAKSSQRFEDWLHGTKLYQTYVADYRETKSISKKRKKRIILQIYLLMGISIYLAPLWFVKLGLLGLTIFISYYLFKVIPDKEE